MSEKFLAMLIVVPLILATVFAVWRQGGVTTRVALIVSVLSIGTGSLVALT